jgi:hypothetical protein
MIDIDREHSDFRRQKLTWRSYRDLYAGGQQFKQRAADYLLRRQKEPLDVYRARTKQARAFYRNWRMIAICAERILPVFSNAVSAMRLSQAAAIF